MSSATSAVNMFLMIWEVLVIPGMQWRAGRDGGRGHVLPLIRALEGCQNDIVIFLSFADATIPAKNPWDSYKKR